MSTEAHTFTPSTEERDKWIPEAHWPDHLTKSKDCRSQWEHPSPKARWDQGDSLVVKLTCSCRGPGFRSQHPHAAPSHLFLQFQWLWHLFWCVSVDLTPLLACGVDAYTQGQHTCRLNTHTYNVIINKSLKTENKVVPTCTQHTNTHIHNTHTRVHTHTRMF